MENSLKGSDASQEQKKQDIINELTKLSEEERNNIFNEFTQQKKDLEKEENLLYLCEKPNMSETDKKNMRLVIRWLIDLKKTSDCDKHRYENCDERDKNGYTLIRPVKEKHHTWITKADYVSYIKQLERITYTKDYIEMGGMKFSKNMFRGYPTKKTLFDNRKKIIESNIDVYFSFEEMYHQKECLEKDGMTLLTEDDFNSLLREIPSYQINEQRSFEGLHYYTILPIILGLPKSGYLECEKRDFEKTRIYEYDNGTESCFRIDNNAGNFKGIKFDSDGKCTILDASIEFRRNCLLPCRPIYK